MKKTLWKKKKTHMYPHYSHSFSHAQLEYFSSPNVGG